MLVLLLTVSAHARISPAPGNPAKPAGAPAPSVTFGIGASDSVFADGGRYRVLYDWRGDHRFRLISAASPSGNAEADLQSPASTACTSITSQVGGTVGLLPVFSTDNGTVLAKCNVEVSDIFEQYTGTYVGDVGIGTTSPTQILTVNGPNEILSTGTGAGFKFGDRTTGNTETTVWYTSNSISRLYRSDLTTNGGDAMSVALNSAKDQAYVGINTDQPGLSAASLRRCKHDWQ
jgi:hypothetical protein